MRLLLPVIGLLMYIPAGAQVQELYLKGIAASERGNYPEAIEMLEEARGVDNDNPELLLALGVTYNMAGEKEAAITNLEKLEGLEPGMGSLELARIYASEDNAAEAVKYLRRHLESGYKISYSKIMLDETFYPVENTEQWRKLWSVDWYSVEEELLQELEYQIHNGDFLPALEKIDIELASRSDWDALHAARGKVLLEMKQNQGSVQSFSKAIELNPSNPEYFTGRGSAYSAMEKHEQAIPDLERAYRLEPENLELLSQIALQYQLDKQYTKAIKYLENYMGYFPDNVETIFRIGRIHYETGSYLDAMRYYNDCLELEVSDPMYFTARGKTYLKTKTYKYALNDFGMALDLDPSDPDVWFYKAEARWYLNDRDGAIGDWEKAARLGSYDALKKLEKYSQK